MKTTQILIAGFGGQGILFAGKFLAYKGLLEDLQVSWLPSYGPEMRGGTANCNVILSEESVGHRLLRALKGELRVIFQHVAHHHHVGQGGHARFVGHLGGGDVEDRHIIAAHLLPNQGGVHVDLPAGDHRVHVLLQAAVETVSTVSACVKIPVYRFSCQGRTLGLYLSTLGGPAAVGILEEIWVKGAEKVLFFGTCGGPADHW